MNILITSAGRRTSLLAAFKEAAGFRGGKVYAGDMDGLAPALYLADGAVKLPPVTSPEYIGFLLDFVNEKGIKLVVPTIDTELMPLAETRDRFVRRGCTALISSPDFVSICRDKLEFYRVFTRLGIRTPRSWSPEEALAGGVPEKLFVKPRDGSASKDAYAADRDQLEPILDLVPNAVVQERIAGREITIDAFLDFKGKPISYVPRVRQKTIGGESVQGVTIREPGLGLWLENLLELVGQMGGVGPMTMQAFLTGDEFVLFEINPRFGGGFPLGNAAGCNSPEMLLRILAGQRVSPKLGEYKVGMSMSRYYSEVFTMVPKWN